MGAPWKYEMVMERRGRSGSNPVRRFGAGQTDGGLPGRAVVTHRSLTVTAPPFPHLDRNLGSTVLSFPYQDRESPYEADEFLAFIRELRLRSPASPPKPVVNVR
jgi:hypothetical protein